MLNIRGSGELARRSGPDHAAALDQVMAVGDARQRRDILIDNEDGLAFGLESREAAPDFGADHRGETFGRLVEN